MTRLCVWCGRPQVRQRASRTKAGAALCSVPIPGCAMKANPPAVMNQRNSLLGGNPRFLAQTPAGCADKQVEGPLLPSLPGQGRQSLGRCASCPRCALATFDNPVVVHRQSQFMQPLDNRFGSRGPRGPQVTERFQQWSVLDIMPRPTIWISAASNCALSSTAGRNSIPCAWAAARASSTPETVSWSVTAIGRQMRGQRPAQPPASANRNHPNWSVCKWRSTNFPGVARPPSQASTPLTNRGASSDP